MNHALHALVLPLALVLTVVGAAATPSAARIGQTFSFPVGVTGCAGSAMEQLCTPMPTVALPTDGVLRARFTAVDTHCSDIIAHMLIDGVEQFVSGQKRRCLRQDFVRAPQQSP